MSRTRLTTNDKIKAILEGAVRARFDDNVGDNATGARKEEFERGKRMASLYGVNHSSKLVKQRVVKRAHHKKDPTNLNPKSRRALEFRTLLNGGDSVMEKDSLDSLSSSLTSSTKNPIDLELRTGSPYRQGMPDSTKPAAPWYVGYSNSTTGPPSSVAAKASRYGFSGSMSMSALDRPSTTVGSIPSFLSSKNPVDEWAPKLGGTPVLWPEDSAYVSGSTLRHRNTHWVAGPKHERSYTKGKSWDKLNDKNPNRFRSLRRAYDREEEESLRLNESVFNERRRIYKTPASMSTSRMLGGSLGSEGGGAGDRRLKYWSNFTLVYSEEQNPELVREKLQKEKEDRLLRYKLKWKEMKTLNKVLKASRQPNNEDLDNYSDSLQKTAAENPDPTCLSRDQFCKIMLNAHGSHPSINAKHCNRVFSSYDPKRRDRVDIRELVGTLWLMRKADTLPMSKLADMFTTFDIEPRGALTLAELRTIMLMPASRDEDKESMIREFNFSFADYFKKGNDMQDISLQQFNAVLQENDELANIFERQLQNSLKMQ